MCEDCVCSALRFGDRRLEASTAELGGAGGDLFGCVYMAFEG